MSPAKAYFMDVKGFPDVKVAGLTAEEQERNRADFYRFIRMAHDRGIRVTWGFGVTTTDSPRPGP